MDISERKKDRFLFLKHLYTESGGDSGIIFHTHPFGWELGFEPRDVDRIVDYLRHEGLAATRGKGYISISHNGIKEVEQAIESPDRPTEHFLPFNIINIGTMTNSSLQQGTTNSNLNFTFDAATKSNVGEILRKIKSIQDELDISPENQQELRSDIQAIESQTDSPKPKNIVITESLKSIRTILESVAGNALTPLIVEQISNLLK